MSMKRTFLAFIIFQRSKLGFYVPLNNQDILGQVLSDCHLWELNPHRSDNQLFDIKHAYPLGNILVEYNLHRKI